VDEELGKAIEGAVERGLRLLDGQGFGAGERRRLAGGGGRRGRELKVVVCVARGGESVRVAALSLQVLVVFVLDGELFCAHEQQMLDSVSHTGHVVGIAETANVDVHGGAGLVRVRVVDQQRFEVVR